MTDIHVRDCDNCLNPFWEDALEEGLCEACQEYDLWKRPSERTGPFYLYRILFVKKTQELQPGLPYKEFVMNGKHY